MRLTRGGVTLVELLVAISLTTLVAGLVLGSLTGYQRLAQAQAERAGARAGLRTGAQLATIELRDLSAAGPSDLLTLGPHQVVYRARRATALACGLGADGLLLRDSTFRALRLPVPARDSLDVLLPDPAGPGFTWVRAGITGPPRSSSCPGGAGGSALALPVDPAFAPAVPDGSPVRTWEVMEVRAYASGGETWLGTRSVSAGETIQPVLGPLVAGGAVLAYLDPDGVPTSDPARVARIVFSLRIRRDLMMALGGAARPITSGVESTHVAVHLPNGAAP